MGMMVTTGSGKGVDLAGFSMGLIDFEKNPIPDELFAETMDFTPKDLEGLSEQEKYALLSFRFTNRYSYDYATSG